MEPPIVDWFNMKKIASRRSIKRRSSSSLITYGESYRGKRRDDTCRKEKRFHLHDIFRKCGPCKHRFGRIQTHDLKWPWSLGVQCRSLVRIKKTFKCILPRDGSNIYATYEGGILLAEHEKGEVGVFVHLIVGKGGSDRKLSYNGFHA